MINFSDLISNPDQIPKRRVGVCDCPDDYKSHGQDCDYVKAKKEVIPFETRYGHPYIVDYEDFNCEQK